jgi:Squalene-hopene cyclase C-terminal domain
MGLHPTASVHRVVNYLLETRDAESDSGCDGSVAGKGHPGILYLEYPVYPGTFPLMALTDYLSPGTAQPCSNGPANQGKS